MNIELDGIPLVWTQRSQAGGVTEIRNVSNIRTSDQRSMVEMEIPGMEGNVFQNLGRAPVKISFEGSFQGKTAKSNLETLRLKFKQGEPIPFNSNISGAADVTKVLIEDLQIEDFPGMANRYGYTVVLREYREPPPEPTPPPSQDEAAEEWSREVAEEAAESINVLTGKILNAEGEPKSGISVVVASAEGEYRAETDAEGVYRIEDLPPGKYRVTVDEEEYAGVEEIVVIGEGEERPGEEVGAEETTEETGEEMPEGPAEDMTKEEPEG